MYDPTHQLVLIIQYKYKCNWGHLITIQSKLLFPNDVHIEALHNDEQQLGVIYWGSLKCLEWKYVDVIESCIASMWEWVLLIPLLNQLIHKFWNHFHFLCE